VTPLLEATGLKKHEAKTASSHITINTNVVCFSSISPIPAYRKKNADPK